MNTTRRRLVAGLSMGLASVLGAAAINSPAYAESSRGGAISRSEVMARAQYWLDHQPGPYSPQGATSPGPGGDFNYRRDCSGYTSMAWHLNGNPSTRDIPNYGPQISKSDLKPGDVLNDYADHVVIFKSWANKAHTRINYYSFGSTPVKMRTNVALNTGMIDSHPASDYKAVRYRNITEDTAENEQPRLADVTGDGYTDLVGVSSTGALLMYPNNIRRDGVPYSGTGQAIGSGWGSFKQVIGADVTGDGYRDLLALTTDGTLKLYANNIERDNGDPYTASKDVGHGFGVFAKLFPADVTGDGYTDLIALTTDGTLRYYGNNIERDNGVPFSGTGTTIGTGWGDFKDIVPADVTGDGYTDLLGVKADGTLKLYANNIERDNGVPYSGNREVGHGFGGFSRVIPADVTGDGYTDLITLTTDGTLRYYGNNIVRDNGVPFSGTGTTIGTGWGGFTSIL